MASLHPGLPLPGPPAPRAPVAPGASTPTALRRRRFSWEGRVKSVGAPLAPAGSGSPAGRLRAGSG
jgi:hypothetical protein